MEKYGLSLLKQDNKILVDNLQWNGLAKKSGFEMDDSITELKIENLERPSKNYVYPLAFILFSIFGYLNYKRKKTK